MILQGGVALFLRRARVPACPNFRGEGGRAFPLSPNSRNPRHAGTRALPPGGSNLLPQVLKCAIAQVTRSRLTYAVLGLLDISESGS